ncbi:MAG: hypothetical protein R3F56_04975 [Planctomycetota bacterium]
MTTRSILAFAVLSLPSHAIAQSVLFDFFGVPGDAFGSAVAGPGDVDLDGYPDVAVAAPARNGGGGGVDVFSGRTGALVWSLAGVAGEGLGRDVLAAGDIDRDGHADLWVRTASAVLACSGRTGGVLWRVPTADFVAAAGDVDLDGHADLLLGTADLGGTSVYAVVGGATGGILWAHVPAPMRLVALGSAGDIDRDGHDDVIATLTDPTGSTRTLEIRSGRTQQVLRSTSASAYYGEGSLVGPAGDWNGDGYDDTFVMQDRVSPPPTFSVGYVTVRSGLDGAQLWGYSGSYYCDRYAICTLVRLLSRFERGGDFDGDGLADPLLWLGGEVVVLPRVVATSLELPSSVVAYAGDVDRDGRDDLIVGLGDRVQVIKATVGLRSLGGFGYVPRIGESYAVAGVGDLDGDGYDEVAYSARGYTAFGDIFGCTIRSSRDASAVLGFSGSGTFPSVLVAAPAGDVSGDGRGDVVVGFNSVSPPRTDHRAEVWANGVELYQFDNADTSYGIAVAGDADWNGDGRADVFVAAQTFTEVWSGATGSLLYTLPAGGRHLVSLGDVNADGVGDVAIGNDVYSGSNRQVLLHLTSAPYAAGDTDNDGHADLWLVETAGATLYSARLGVLRVLPWPQGQAAAMVSAGVDWDGDGVGDLLAGFPSASPGGTVVVMSGLDGRPLFTQGGGRTGDAFGHTAALLRAPAGAAASLAADSSAGGPLATGYAWLVREPRTPGGQVASGRGCVGGVGVPRLAWIGAPRLGSSGSFALDRAPATTAAVFILGGSEDQWLGASLPLPLAGLGMAECVLHAAADVLVPTVTDGGGRATLPLTLPADPILVGARLLAQTAQFDPATNPRGVTMSEARRMVIMR